MFNCAIDYAYISDFKQCIFVISISPLNAAPERQARSFGREARS